MKLISLATAALILSVSNVDARQFNCGLTMCRLVGISKAQCVKLGLAYSLNWPNRFQRVSMPAPQMVVVQRRAGRNSAGGPGGHVSLIVSVDANGNTAIVKDNRGVYRRNIKRNLVAFVAPSARWSE